MSTEEDPRPVSDLEPRSAEDGASWWTPGFLLLVTFRGYLAGTLWTLWIHRNCQ